MPEFLAETYTPWDASGARAAASSAGDRPPNKPAAPGAPVRFLGAIVVPEEETCFWLYQAPCADAVRAAMTAAGLRPERITLAMTLTPPPPSPGPAPQHPTGSPAPEPGPQGTPPGPHRTCPSAPGTGPP
jgi:hypothetical protein